MNNMKKTIRNMYRLSIFYFVVALTTGLFHHNIEYWTNFTGISVLKYVHPHSTVLGGFLFLLLPLFVKVFSIHKSKYFKRFMIIYNVGLIGSLFFMSFKGVRQLYDIAIPKFWNHMSSGLAGISHVILTVGIFFLFRTLQTSIKENE